MIGKLVIPLIDPAVHHRSEYEIFEHIVALQLEVAVGTMREDFQIRRGEMFAARRTLDVVCQKNLCISVCHSPINITSAIEIPSPGGYFIKMNQIFSVDMIEMRC